MRIYTDEKFEKGNRAIAKYQGISFVPKYHKSWNDLMPVLCRILKDKYHLLLSDGVASIYPDLDMNSFIVHDHARNPLVNVWILVAEYCIKLRRRKSKRSLSKISG